MSATAFSPGPSADEIAELRARLEEAEETLRAIRSGEVDALVVEGPAGHQIFSLNSAEAESNRLRGEILSQVNDAVIAIDREQRVTFLNAAAERQYRVNSAEVLGCEMDAVFENRWRTPEDEVAARAALRERGEWRGENVHVTREGRVFDVESSVTVLLGEDGTDGGSIAVIRDITERKRAEIGLEMAKKEAEAANRAKDAFLSALSHELRTPLNPVKMAVSALLSDGVADGSLREDLEMILRNVDLEVRLIDDLLDVTRIAHGKLVLAQQPCDLHEIVRHAMQVCDHTIREKRLEVLLRLDAPDANVVGDGQRLQQVFWNLVSNASKFTPEGGRVTVWSEMVRPGVVQVGVRDNGVGIDPLHLPVLFEAFEQGGGGMTQRFGGLGLGLAICRGIVDLHGGRIWAESEGEGKGATFVVELAATPRKEG